MWKMFRVCLQGRRSAEGLAARRSGRFFSVVGRHSAVPSRCPSPAPHSAPTGRGATHGKADWLRNYRRSATGLAAGAVPLHPSPHPQGAGLLVGKQIGRAITAARRQASRLAAGAVPLHPGLPAVAGRAYVENVSGLPTWPPLGGRPRGSPVWWIFLDRWPSFSSPPQCPSPCTASYRHGTADTACRSGQPNEKASVTQTSHWLFRVRSSPSTRRRRAADYMDHSA